MSSQVTDTETNVQFAGLDQPLLPHQEPHNAEWCVAIGLRLEPDANGGDPHIVLDPVDADLARDLNALTDYVFNYAGEGSGGITEGVRALADVTRSIALLAAKALGDPDNGEYLPDALVPEVFVNENTPYFLMAAHFMKGTGHDSDPVKAITT